jgi:hypothetical protein
MPTAPLFTARRSPMRHFNKGGESPSGIAGIADLAPGEGGVKHARGTGGLMHAMQLMHASTEPEARSP